MSNFEKSFTLSAYALAFENRIKELEDRIKALEFQTKKTSSILNHSSSITSRTNPNDYKYCIDCDILVPKWFNKKCHCGNLK